MPQRRRAPSPPCRCRPHGSLRRQTPDGTNRIHAIESRIGLRTSRRRTPQPVGDQPMKPVRVTRRHRPHVVVQVGCAEYVDASGPKHSMDFPKMFQRVGDMLDHVARDARWRASRRGTDNWRQKLVERRQETVLSGSSDPGRARASGQAMPGTSMCRCSVPDPLPGCRPHWRRCAHTTHGIRRYR